MSKDDAAEITIKPIQVTTEQLEALTPPSLVELAWDMRIRELELEIDEDFIADLRAANERWRQAVDTCVRYHLDVEEIDRCYPHYSGPYDNSVIPSHQHPLIKEHAQAIIERRDRRTHDLRGLGLTPEEAKEAFREGYHIAQSKIVPCHCYDCSSRR